MTSEAQKRASAKYDAANTVQIKMKLNTATDAAIISALETVRNKQGYIKDLIRKDIKMKDELKRRVITLEFEGKVSHEQGYRLRQLIDEGYDIEPGLTGRIEGYHRNTLMADAIRNKDPEKIEVLIRETRDEELEEERLLKEHLERHGLDPK